MQPRAALSSSINASLCTRCSDIGRSHELEIQDICDKQSFPLAPSSKECVSNVQQYIRKTLGETQMLRAGCSKAEPKIFAPPQTPFPGAQDGQNLITWRWSQPSPTDPVWWRSMHAISSYRGNSPTNKQTHKHTHASRQDRLQYTAPLNIARSVNISLLPSDFAFLSRLYYYYYYYYYEPGIRFLALWYIKKTYDYTVTTITAGLSWYVSLLLSLHTVYVMCVVACIPVIVFFCTLRAKRSGAMYCNRSCLWVCLCVCVCVFVGLLPR